jgi:hypothetical protein
MIKGTPKFDGLVVAVIEINFLKNPGTVAINVQTAFINERTGDTHAWSRGSPGWSDETRGLIQDLRASMERDLAGRHFIEGSLSDGASPATVARKGPSGLGEHLGTATDDDVPSV